MTSKLHVITAFAPTLAPKAAAELLPEDTFIAAQWELSVNQPPLTDPQDYGGLYTHSLRQLGEGMKLHETFDVGKSSNGLMKIHYSSLKLIA